MSGSNKRYEVQWDKKAYKDYVTWQAKDPKVAKKIATLIDSIKDNGPIGGVGRPESLLNRKQFTRRINDWHRLVYSMQGDVATIISCKGHTKRDADIIKRCQVALWSYMRPVEPFYIL